MLLKFKHRLTQDDTKRDIQTDKLNDRFDPTLLLQMVFGPETSMDTVEIRNPSPDCIQTRSGPQSEPLRSGYQARPDYVWTFLDHCSDSFRTSVRTRVFRHAQSGLRLRHGLDSSPNPCLNNSTDSKSVQLKTTVVPTPTRQV